MVELLELTAWKIYESGRQSTEPYFKIAIPLLERLASTDLVKKSRVKLAETQYQLSMVLRNAVERDQESDAVLLLKKAIDHCRISLSFKEIADDIERRSMVVVSLGNCISNLYELEGDDELLEEGIAALRLTLVELKARGEMGQFIVYVCNSLGVLLIKKINSKERTDRESLVEEALEIFKESISNSEKEMLQYPWASAKLNFGNLFMERSYLFESDTEESKFNRVVAISEFQATLDSFTILNLPMEFAQAHANLGRALVEHAATGLEGELTELYLARAIASYEIAVNAFTEHQYPQKWASITSQMARIFAIHAQLDGVESAKYDLEPSAFGFTHILPS